MTMFAPIYYPYLALIDPCMHMHFLNRVGWLLFWDKFWILEWLVFLGRTEYWTVACPIGLLFGNSAYFNYACRINCYIHLRCKIVCACVRAHTHTYIYTHSKVARVNSTASMTLDNSGSKSPTIALLSVKSNRHQAMQSHICSFWMVCS